MKRNGASVEKKRNGASILENDGVQRRVSTLACVAGKVHWGAKYPPAKISFSDASDFAWGTFG